MNFRALASSSAGCAYVLSGGGAIAPLLIEAGIRFDEIQKALDFKTSDLAGCLITHAHGDHSKGAREVVSNGIDVYATRETLEALPYTGRHHRAHVLEEAADREYAEVLVGDWIVKPFATIHDTPGAVGFFIGAPNGEKLLFLTDSAYSRHVFEGMTMIAAEANWSSEILRRNTGSGQVDGARANRTIRTHMSIERLIDFFKASDLSQVEEIYLLHLSNENSDEAMFKRLVEEATGIPTFVCSAREAVA